MALRLFLISTFLSHSSFLLPVSDRIDKTEKDLTEQQKNRRDEIMKIQETAKQIQMAAVQKQTQANAAVEQQ